MVLSGECNSLLSDSVFGTTLLNGLRRQRHDPTVSSMQRRSALARAFIQFSRGTKAATDRPAPASHVRLRSYPDPSRSPTSHPVRSARRACPHRTDGDPRRRSRATRRDRAEPPPHPWRGGCVPAHHLRVARSAAGGASSPSSIGGRDRWVMGPDRSTETPTGRNETGCRCALLHFVHGEPNRPHGTERAACNRREGGDH